MVQLAFAERRKLPYSADLRWIHGTIVIAGRRCSASGSKLSFLGLQPGLSRHDVDSRPLSGQSATYTFTERDRHDIARSMPHLGDWGKAPTLRDSESVPA